jgi:hypothetical protein
MQMCEFSPEDNRERLAFPRERRGARFAKAAICFYLALVLPLVALVVLQSAPALAQASGGDGPDVPFPTLGALPLPWDQLEGVWEFSAQGQTSQFSFEVRGRASRRFLRILEVDPKTLKVIAIGTGVATENDRVIRATMRSRQAVGEDYALMLRYFVDPKVTGMGTLPATLLTLRPITVIAANQDFVVRKVLAAPYIMRRGQAVPRP